MPPVPSTNICHVIYEPGITLCPIYYILCYVDGLAILSNRSNACNPVTSIAREHEVRMTSLRTMPPLCQPPTFSIQSLSSIIFCLIFASVFCMCVCVCVYIFSYIRSKFFLIRLFLFNLPKVSNFSAISLWQSGSWSLEFLIFFWLFIGIFFLLTFFSPSLIFESHLKNF